MKITRRNFTVAMLAACAASAALPGFVKAQDGKAIAILFDSLQSPFWVTSFAVLKEKAAAAGWTPLEAISNLDDSKQFEQVQSMLQRQVDGIIIVQTDSNAVIPAIREANKAGVPMVHFNRPPAKSDAKSVAIQADNKEIMKSTVQALVDIAKAKGGKYQAAILIGDLGDQNAVQRRDGFFEVVEQYKDMIEVVARISTEWNADKAFADLTNALQANPGINFLVTSSDFLIPQIRQALTVAGKWKKSNEEGHVLFAGFDGDEGQYQALSEGYMDVGGVQDLFFEADLAINAIKKIRAGEQVDALLLDPGFVLTQATLEADRDRSWGYTVWKAQN
ncbi:sugar ABC transporter substrate-binding protein [Mesorhizobium sp. ISC11]|uniref:sugar ABC transporter substrate-binding protein n=1 Tax=Mesorhizobium sp. ISC11 TaxID=3076428 RepID=UPI00301DC553